MSHDVVDVVRGCWHVRKRRARDVKAGQSAGMDRARSRSNAATI